MNTQIESVDLAKALPQQAKLLPTENRTGSHNMPLRHNSDTRLIPATNGANATAFVYCVGSIQAHFPSLNLEKEFYQAMQLANINVSALSQVNDDVDLGQLNQNQQLPEVLYNGLSAPQNAYIARQMEWFFSNTEHNNQYRLFPSSINTLTQFIAALAPDQDPFILIGEFVAESTVVVTALTSTSECPVAKVLRQHSGDKHFISLASEILSLNTNPGNDDELRALNYTLYFNEKVYTHSDHLQYHAPSHSANPSGYQLVKVSTERYMSGNRRHVKVIFHYQGINTGAIQSWFSSVDVSGEFPFVVTQWRQYLSYSHGA